jgi:hypothetical protein
MLTGFSVVDSSLVVSSPKSCISSESDLCVTDSTVICSNSDSSSFSSSMTSSSISCSTFACSSSVIDSSVIAEIVELFAIIENVDVV